MTEWTRADLPHPHVDLEWHADVLVALDRYKGQLVVHLNTRFPKSDGAVAVMPEVVSGDDRAVFVVLESDVAAVEVAYGDRGWESRGLGYGDSDARTMRLHVQRLLKDAAGCEAIARAIEAEQAVDPVEERARSQAEVQADAWDACVSEGEACGHLGPHDAAELEARNPYRPDWVPTEGVGSDE